jgi:hypothetical protein
VFALVFDSFLGEFEVNRRMDQGKRERIAGLMAEGKTQAQIVEETGWPQPTISRYMADIAVASVPDDRRARWLEIFRQADRQGNVTEMRHAQEELDRIAAAARAVEPKPELPPGQLEETLVASICEHFLGHSPNSARGLPPEVPPDEILISELKKAMVRDADNEKMLAYEVRLLALKLKVTLRPEIEAEVQKHESEEGE